MRKMMLLISITFTAMFFSQSSHAFLWFKAKEVSQEVSVVTMNMARMQDEHKLYRVIENWPGGVYPDVMLMQEVMFDGRNSMAKRLAKKLRYYYFEQKRTTENEGVAIVSRYKLRSTNALIHKSIDEYERISLYAKIEHPYFGDISLVNTHLAYKSASTRRRQVSELNSWLLEQELGNIQFIGGDLNATIYSQEVKSLRSKNDLKSYNKTSLGSYIGGRSHKRIDFVFVNDRYGKLNFQGEKVIFPKGQLPSRETVSDHLFIEHSFKAN